MGSMYGVRVDTKSQAVRSNQGFEQSLQPTRVTKLVPNGDRHEFSRKSEIRVARKSSHVAVQSAGMA